MPNTNDIELTANYNYDSFGAYATPLTLGKFRELTKDLPDDMMIVYYFDEVCQNNTFTCFNVVKYHSKGEYERDIQGTKAIELC